jgi:hypothetical protein
VPGEGGAVQARFGRNKRIEELMSLNGCNAGRFLHALKLSSRDDATPEVLAAAPGSYLDERNDNWPVAPAEVRPP